MFALIARRTLIASRPLLLPRAISTSTSLLASGQGGREVKAKKKSKGSIKFAEKANKKKGAKEIEEDEEDDEDEWDTRRSSRSAKDEVDQVQLEVEKVGEKMKGFSSWFGEKAQEIANRARGKVSPSALDSVRIVLPKTTAELSLNSISTTSVKGNTLIINVFDEAHTKPIENAIHKANLSGLSPTTTDSRTVTIVVPKPSSSDKATMLKTLSTQAESSKQNVRQARMASMKVLGKDGAKELQEVTDKYTKEIDGLMIKAKKELA